MKINYIIFLTIIFLLVSFLGKAQVAPPTRIKGDFKVGIDWSEMDITGGNMYKKPKIGVLIGGNINYRIFSGFQLQSGLYAIKKGLRQSHKGTTEDPITGITTKENWKYIVDANYIQVPLNIGFEHYFTKELAFNVNGGVYVAYGLKGKRETQGTRTIIAGSSTTQINLDSGKSDTFAQGQLSRFDYGVGFNIGVIYDIYSLTFGYDKGLYNVSNADNVSMKTRTTYVALGFRF